MARKKCSGTQIVMWFLLGFVFGQCAGPGCAVRADEVDEAPAVEQAPPTVRVLTAAHEGELADQAILWRSTYELAPAQQASAEVLRLEMAVPLPADVQVHAGEPPLAPVLDEQGRIVGFDVVPTDLLRHYPQLRIELEQPLPERRGIRLAAPMVAGDAVQAVAVVGSETAIFEPAPSTGLLRHVGFSSARGLQAAQRRRADQLLGPAWQGWGKGRVYLRVGPQLLEAGGLTGDLLETPERTRPALAVAGAVLPLLVLGLVLMHRRLDRSAKVERAEKVLEQEMGSIRRRAGRDQA